MGADKFFLSLSRGKKPLEYNILTHENFLHLP